MDTEHKNNNLLVHARDTVAWILNDFPERGLDVPLTIARAQACSFFYMITTSYNTPLGYCLSADHKPTDNYVKVIANLNKQFFIIKSCFERTYQTEVADHSFQEIADDIMNYVMQPDSISYKDTRLFLKEFLGEFTQCYNG